MTLKPSARTVKRPDSTTVWLEFPFHVIKSGEEFLNIVESSSADSRIEIVQRLIDEESFTPKIAVWVHDIDKLTKQQQRHGYILTFEAMEDARALHQDHPVIELWKAQIQKQLT